MNKIMNFVLIVLCFFSFNIFANAAAKVNSAIQEIRNEKNRTDKEKLTVRKNQMMNLWEEKPATTTKEMC